MSMSDAYRRAAAIFGANRKKHVLNESIQTHWIAGTDDFWYKKDVVTQSREIGGVWLRFCFEKETAEPLFDHDRLAAELALLAGESPEENAEQEPNPDSQKLPVTVRDVDGETGAVYLTVDGKKEEYVFGPGSAKLTVLETRLHTPGEALSPDRRRSVFLRDHNLFCRDNRTGETVALTTDGSPDRPYAVRNYGPSEQLISADPYPGALGLKWAPDSRHLLTYRSNAGEIGKMALVQACPIEGEGRPKFVQYPYALPEDEKIMEAEVVLIDAETGEVRPVSLQDGPLRLLLQAMFVEKNDQLKWTADSSKAWLLRYDRYFKKAEAVLIDIASATAKVIASYTYQTFGFTEYFGFASQEIFNDSGLLYLPENRQLIWLLEKEEHAALYLFDAETGEELRCLTPGDYTVRRIRHYDAERRLLYFSASGREPGVDPYYQFLYCVSLDGGDVRLLTPEPAEHVSRFQPEGKYFIDAFSTIQTAPVHRVCLTDGRELFRLAEAVLSRIFEKGYLVPEPFEALAEDGETRLYGVLVRPYGFDPAKKYPIIDCVYGGAQRIHTPKAFEFNVDGLEDFDPQEGLQSLAQLGFVTVIIDGRGTPLRTKTIHDASYGHLDDCCCLQDHVAVIRQLSKKHSWIDTERVGIWGSSGGGYSTVMGLLTYPDFYKVGVAMCGNYDQANYHAHWGNRWNGPCGRDVYERQNSCSRAEALKGKLLLIHGEMDDNVHPSATLRLVQAFIAANKDFDLLFYPNSSHGVGQYPYVTRRKWDFFVRHLLGETPPENYLLK